MLSIQQLQLILLGNGGAILENISFEEIETYNYIKEALHAENVSKNMEFQEQFSELYKFDQNHIPSHIRGQFFVLLEKQKNKSVMSIPQLSRKLFGMTSSPHDHTYFSLLTCLMHTIHENYPIYNHHVAKVFNYHPPQRQKLSFFRKFSEYASFYNHQINVYREFCVGGNCMICSMR